MKKYLYHTFSENDKEMVSTMDELPLWSAPFGLSLLDTIKLGKGFKVLDIGSGLGFPLIEIAQRLGESSKVFGIDPWEEANERANLKIKKYNLKNVEVIKGTAEDLPFEDSYFDLIVSNNGINNVNDLTQTLKECSRTAKSGAQFVFTMNLEDTMKEFYNPLKKELEKRNLHESIKKMAEQIYSKRRPLNEITKLLDENDFRVNEIKHDIFYLRFADAESMFNHSLIKYWFLDGWKSIIDEDMQEEVFDKVETRMNESIKKDKHVKLSVPFVTVDCERK